jgi:putative membrane protein
MSRVISVTGALVAATLATAPGAFAQDTTGAAPWPTVRAQPTVLDTGTSSSVADTFYIRQVIRSNFTEVGAGRLAESRAEDSEVKNFGERMVSEHNAMNEEWARLARDNDMRIDVDFGAAGKQTIDQLDNLEGIQFDQAYMNAMIRQHENDLATFQRMSSSAQSSDVRQLANNGLSTIQQHLMLARQVGSRVGVSTTAGRVGGVTPLPAPQPSNEDRARRPVNRNEIGTLRSEDREFVETVLGAHLLEIQLAERARSRARSDEIQRLAERLDEDFTEWRERWEKVADRHNVDVPSHLGTLRRDKLEKLEDASQRKFDRTYAELVVDHLEAVLPYYEKEGRDVRPNELRRLVDEQLPLIREHLARARQLERQMRNR